MNIKGLTEDAIGGINVVRDKYKAAKIAAGGGKGDAETQDIEIAVAKATNHDETSPKEKHVRTLTFACEPGQETRRNVQMIMHLLTKRANNDHGWLITLKCMMTMHRLMRDTHLAFIRELIQWSARRGNRGAFGMNNYKDVKDPLSWDHCSWIRVYSIYLDETVDFYRATHFDFMAEKEMVANKIRGLSPEKLLDLLPRLQRLQSRLTGCLPEGRAIQSGVVLDATLLVLRESFRLYHANSEAIVCMVDRFFEMDRVSALKAIDIYKQAIDGTDSMSLYFKHTKGLDNISRTVSFPEINAPPHDFLQQMEEYAASAPVDAGAAMSPKSSTQKVEATPFPSGAGGKPSANMDIGDLLGDLDLGGSSAQQGAAPAVNPFGDDAFPIKPGAGNSSAFEASPGFNDPFCNNVSQTAGFAVMPAASPSLGVGAPAPFASSTSTPSNFGATDSFGAQTGFVTSQMAAPKNNPFGGSGSFAAPADPFAQQPADPFGSNNPFGGLPDPFTSQAAAQPAAFAPTFGSADPFSTAPMGGFPPGVQPLSQNTNPALASVMGGQQTVSGNPFINSGIQPDMMNDRSKKSVHDPFAALTAEMGGPGRSPNKPEKPQVPMKPQQNFPSSGFGSSFPDESKAPVAANPFGDFSPGF